MKILVSGARSFVFLGRHVSDATTAEDEQQEGNDREDDENGVEHGP
jgi:hypothetical protein